jgi:LL-diaminopimelate aminotransferase
LAPGTQSERLAQLPPYLFAKIERQLADARAAGRDIIDFGIGDPDQPTPGFIIERLAAAASEPANHRYPPSEGISPFRHAAAGFLSQRFGVRLDPDEQVLALIGTKEGLGHLPMAVINPGEVVLVPEPGYPVYRAAAVLAGARSVVMPLRAEHAWLPALEDIPSDVAHQARLMYLNYPNNPTAATATPEFFAEAVRFAAEHDILIAHDAAYSELYLGPRCPSILQVAGAAEVAIEFHSLSKTYNMSGWRLGFAAGCKQAVAALRALKSNVDSGTFTAIQQAGIAALGHYDHPEVQAKLDVYRQRRDLLVDGLNRLGLRTAKPAATFFVWAACPAGYDSQSMASRLLADADVLALPGVGFGQAGEGYSRFALTLSTERIREALERIGKLRL